MSGTNKKPSDPSQGIYKNVMRNGKKYNAEVFTLRQFDNTLCQYAVVRHPEPNMQISVFKVK